MDAQGHHHRIMESGLNSCPCSNQQKLGEKHGADSPSGPPAEGENESALFEASGRWSFAMAALGNNPEGQPRTFNSSQPVLL